MVDNTVTAFVDFYRQMGQNLTPWRAPPPRYKKRSTEEERSETEIGDQLNERGLEREADD